jgi:hypothetical protein
MSERRTFMPAFPFPRLLPWLLGAASAAALVAGLTTDHGELTLLGTAGLGVMIVGYPVARLLLGRDDEDQSAGAGQR